MDENEKIAIAKIINCHRNRSKELDLNGYELTRIPFQLYALENVERIDLGDNNLVEIAPGIASLPKLSELNVSNNKLVSLPRFLGSNGRLTKLFCNNNNLSSLPIGLKNCLNLRSIDISNNKFKELPFWLFNFVDIKKFSFTTTTEDDVLFDNFLFEGKLVFGRNPIESPPIEIINSGKIAIDNYFSELKEKSQYLYEAKLLVVGEPGAGKTSLSIKILDDKNPLPSEEETTWGINIYNYKFNTIDKEDFRVNIWDFGGQEIYKSTHQFFLTKRSIYALLTDNRYENTNFNYWLETIEALSNNSPLVIVQNEKQGRAVELNERALKNRFHNLKEIFQVNLKDNSGLTKLKKEIHHQFLQLPHIGTKLPKTWVDIRDLLEKMSINKNYISFHEYFDVCRKFGIQDKERAKFLSEYLHDLGVFLHFQDSPILKNIVILVPSWATGAVYKVLDSRIVINNKGLFSSDLLKNIWNENKYEDMHHELLELMIKFELCYNITNTDDYIVPQILPIQMPDYYFNYENAIEIKYLFSFMPKGILSKLIVRMHKYISDQSLVWKEGVVLERQGGKAELIESYGKNEIIIKVNGENRKELLTLIIENLDDINSLFERITVSKQIPCNCKLCYENEKPYYFKYENLKKRKSKKIRYAECEESLEKIDIWRLIDDLNSTSYSKNQIMSALRESNIDSVFEMLEENAKETNYLHDLNIMRSRYSHLMSQERKGTVGFGASNKELNKIKNSLLQITHEVSF
jgi:GTPase SAR1 family protein